MQRDIMKFNKELQIKWFYLVFPGLITTALWEIGKHLFNAIAASGNNMINYFANIPYIMAANISADMLLIVFFSAIFSASYSCYYFTKHRY